MLSVTYTGLKMVVFHLNSVNTGTHHDYVHPLDYMAKTPSPPHATHMLPV